tara:strand:+ start:371 stop:502 length:132 start_codon:yes stop_codon:yes gene_type:complete
LSALEVVAVAQEEDKAESVLEEAKVGAVLEEAKVAQGAVGLIR